MKRMFSVTVLLTVLCFALMAHGAETVQPGQTVVSLNAATETGTGTEFQVKQILGARPANRYTWTVKTANSPTGVSVDLEGTIDGADWFVLDTSTSTTSEMRHVLNKPVLWIRANLKTLSGGTAPTVTVKIMPADN